MEGHDVAAMPQEQPETSGTGAGAGWGTCEELLLVSAVKRHGVNNWNLISEELKARAISLNVSPLYFSEAACKQNYDVLRGRYACSSSSSRSRNEDIGNDLHWFEELRKLRVAHLKRELEHYDGSIGSLQVKIKRLKAEKARDTSVSKQLRKSLASPQLNDDMHGGYSCETSVQRSADKGHEVEYKELHSAPVALEPERISQESTSSQAVSNLQQQVLPEGEQWQDAVEDRPDASPACIDVKASVSVINNSPSHNSIKGGNDVEQDDEGNGAALSLPETQLCETSALSENASDDVHDVEADKVGTPYKDEAPEPDSTRTGDQLMDDSAGFLITHDVEDVVSQGFDNDEIQARTLDIQIGQILPMKMVDDGLDIVQADSGQNGKDTTLVASADSASSMEASKKVGSECAEPVSHPKGDPIVLSTLPSSQQLVISGITGNPAGKQAELNAVAEDNVELLKNEEDIGKMEKEQTSTVEEDNPPTLEVGLNKVHVAFLLDLAMAERGVQMERTVLECSKDVTTHAVQSADEAFNSTKDSRTVSEAHDSHLDVTSTTLVEVIPCQQKQLLSEECYANEDDSAAHAVKELATLGAESGETGQHSDSMLMERVSLLKESEKLGVSAVVPIASFINSESSVLKDGAIIFLDKPDTKGSASGSSGVLYISDVGKGSSPSPERHIVIALDGPDKTVPSPKIASIVPAVVEDEDVYQIDSQTQVDVVCDTEATVVEEEQRTYPQSSRIIDSCEQRGGGMAQETPASAMNLPKEVCGTGQENGLLAVEMAQCSGVGKTAPVSPNSSGKSKSMERRPILAVEMNLDAETAEGTTTDNDNQPSTSEIYPKRDSAASETMEIAENLVSVTDQDTRLISPEVQLESSMKCDSGDKINLQNSLGQSSEPMRSASCVAEVEGHQLSDTCLEVEEVSMPTLTAEPQSFEVAKTDPEITANIGQDAADPQNVSHGGECKIPKIIIDMKLEYSKEELSGVDSEAEPSSPLESLAGGLDSKVPSSREGSDSVQDQYKDEGGGRRRERTRGIRECVDSDMEKSEAGSPLDGTDDMSPSSRLNRKDPRALGKLVPLLEVFRNLSNHKSAILFKGRQEDPRYSSLIRRHLDLTTVRQRLDEGAYSVSSEFFRDLLLIFNNAMVYYPRGSIEHQGAKVLLTEATKEMNRIFQTEALLKQDRPATRTREVKKPKALAGVTNHAMVVAPSVGGGSTVKLAGSNLPLTSVPGSGSRKRASSRLGLVETPTNSLSEGGPARSASMNVLGGPSSSRAEDAEISQENDQEVNGRLKDRKKPQKGSGSSRGKPPREELLEGILLKNAASKRLGKPKLKDVKEEDPTLNRPAVPTKGVAGGKLKTELESARSKEAEKDKMRGKEVRGKERDEIGDDDVLRKGKSLAKMREQEIALERGSEAKPVPKSRATTAARAASNSQDTVSHAVGRPSRGGRKPAIPAKELARPSEQQPKKRMRK